MSELSTILSALQARRPDPAEPIWDIRAPGFLRHIFQRRRTDAFYAARSLLLRSAVTQQRALHLIVDAPEVAQVAGVVASGEKGEYRLEADVDLGAVDAAALHYGGWYLYASQDPPGSGDVLRAVQTTDVFRISPAELMRLLAKLGVTFLLASFYDDLEWRLAARRESRPEVAA